MAQQSILLDGNDPHYVTKRTMTPLSVVPAFHRNLCAAVFFLSLFSAANSTPSLAQSITPAPPPNQSTPPQVTKSPSGKQEESARAAARSPAHHFDRVLL